MAVETVGSASRQRTTPQTWFDAQAATLTADQTGECYNDSEFTTAAGYAFSGKTPGAFKFTLKCASGQSFRDNANVRTNALKYNQTNGVGIRQTAGYTDCISGSQTKIYFAGLQIKSDATDGTSEVVTLTGNGGWNNCIIDSASTSTAFAITGIFDPYNMVVFLRGTSGGGVVSQANNTFRHITIVRSSDQTAAGTGFASQYSTNTIINCAIFGFSTCSSGTFASSSNNATDKASGLPGTSNQHSVTYSRTTPFTDADKASLNLISIASTSLAANGVYDSGYATDISAYTRANPPTIGAWEITAAGGAGLPFFMQYKVMESMTSEMH